MGVPGGLGQILNVMTTMANHTGLFKRWVIFANHFLFKSSLSLRDREILILRTGRRTLWRTGRTQLALRATRRLFGAVCRDLASLKSGLPLFHKRR